MVFLICSILDPRTETGERIGERAREQVDASRGQDEGTMRYLGRYVDELGLERIEVAFLYTGLDKISRADGESHTNLGVTRTSENRRNVSEPRAKNICRLGKASDRSTADGYIETFSRAISDFVRREQLLSLINMLPT